MSEPTRPLPILAVVPHPHDITHVGGIIARHMAGSDSMTAVSVAGGLKTHGESLYDELRTPPLGMIKQHPIVDIAPIDGKGSPAARAMLTAKVDDDLRAYSGAYRASNKVSQIKDMWAAALRTGLGLLVALCFCSTGTAFGAGLVNGSFEEAGAAGIPAGWDWFQKNRPLAKVSLDTQTASDGRASVRFSVPEQTEGDAYIMLYQKVTGLPAGARIRLTAMVKGKGVGGYAWIGDWGPHIDNRLILPKGDYDWMQVSHDYFLAKDSTEFTVRIAVHNSAQALWVDDVQLSVVTQDPTLERQAKMWLLIHPMQDRTATTGFDVRVRNPEQKAQQVTITWKLCDPFGAPVRQGRSTFRLAGLQEERLTIPVDPSRRVAGLWAAVLDGRGRTLDSDFQFVAIEPASLQRIDGSKRWGLCVTNMGRGGVTPETRRFDLLAAAGCRSVRGEMSNTFNPQTHKIDPTTYAQTFRSLNSRGIEVLSILGFAPTWASAQPPGTPEDDKYFGMPKLDAWVELVKEYIEAYHLKMVEVWNEPNGGFWNSFPKDETYGALLKATYNAVKEVDPSVKVLACSTNNASTGWPESVLKVAGASSMDAISFHPYIWHRQPFAGPIAPELGQDTTAIPPATTVIGDMNAMSARYNGGKPIPLYITEVGLDQNDRQPGEAIGRDYLETKYVSETLARTLLTYAGLGVKRTFWFEFDDVVPYGGFGTIHSDLSLKPAWWAFRALNERAGSREIGKFQRLGEDLFSLTMRGRSNVVAVWTALDPAVVGIKKPVSAAYDLFGREVKPLRVGAYRIYTIPAGSVLYLTGDRNLESRDVTFFMRMKALSRWAVPGDAVQYTIEASKAAHECFKGKIPLKAAFAVDPEAGKWAVGTRELPIGKTKIAFPILMPTADKVSVDFLFNEQCEPEVRLSNREGEPILAHVRIAAADKIREVHKEIAPSSSYKETLHFRPENPEKGVDVKAYVHVDTREWSFDRKLYFAPVHSGKITVDGRTEDWKGIPRIALRDWYRLAADKPQGFSADMALAYDARYLYVLVEVSEQAHFQKSIASEAWRGDSVQVAFDTKPMGGHHPTEMTFALANDGRYLFYSPRMNEDLTGVEGNIVRQSGKTIYEMRLPLSKFLGVRGKAGSRLGFSLLVNKSNSAGTRVGWLSWSGGIGDTQDAQAYGQILFEK